MANNLFYTAAKLVLVLPFVFFLPACTMIKHSRELLVLKQVSDSQRQASQYVSQQEIKFSALVQNVKNNQLKQGLPKQEIIKRYGEPVFTRPAASDGSGGEMLFYREPVDYFSSDRVYLYCDGAGKLVRWEYKPNR